MMKPIQLDGSEGGGQMLRTALSLAMITGQPFRMTNIRGKRPRPGLMRQHLTCVRAAMEVSDGTADGAEPGSTELVFRAGKVRPGSYQFAIGTAGSTGLLFQTLLPALWHADGESTLVLEGGTHNPLAPPFEFLDRVFLPAVRRLGVEASLTLDQTGFAPAGGGRISAVVRPCGSLAKLELHELGTPLERSLTVVSRRLPARIPQRMLESARAVLEWDEHCLDTREDGPGMGICLLVEQRFEHGSELCSSFGEIGVLAEKIGHRAARAMQNFLGSRAAVGTHLADQLLIPMALAGGGSFTTMKPDDHVRTNIAVIERFLPVKFTVREVERGLRVIACGPA
ncbi:RNA 3'-terminal phosphate cyclase [Luteolibacter sp. LG18]|uniref:RNA 3'-terminal phosphate cyclase n=1 Tax=Luteolibacter sp. LG18 TaxID=2819286 RepID=UPI002B2F0CA1|nr:RNA 3'-terminal phosphate cyclase [Luteolibacter sp. LG18]